jgi:hypothetical protein
MRVSFYFERSCPEQRPRAALQPQEPHSSGARTPGAPTEVLASRGVVVVESRGKWQAAGAAFAVGQKAVLTLLYPPLEPLSHNANPRDGAQDICAWVFICTPEGVSFSGSSHEVGGQETPVEMSCSHVFLSGDAMLSHIVVYAYGL